MRREEAIQRPRIPLIEVQLGYKVNVPTLESKVITRSK